MSHDDQLRPPKREGSSDDVQARFDALVDRRAGASTPADAMRDGDVADVDSADIRWLRTLVIREAQRRADEVPQATFDGVWARALGELERSEVVAVAPAPGLSRNWFSALSHFFTPQRLGWSIAGACAAVMVMAVVWPQDSKVPDSSATMPIVRSVATPLAARPVVALEDAQPVARPQESARYAQGAARVADDAARVGSDEAPLDEPAEAHVERIDFGGRSGRISQIDSARGVTTVIWLSETDNESAPKVQDL